MFLPDHLLYVYLLEAFVLGVFAGLYLKSYFFPKHKPSNGDILDTVPLQTISTEPKQPIDWNEKIQDWLFISVKIALISSVLAFIYAMGLLVYLLTTIISTT